MMAPVVDALRRGDIPLVMALSIRGQITAVELPQWIANRSNRTADAIPAGPRRTLPDSRSATRGHPRGGLPHLAVARPPGAPGCVERHRRTGAYRRQTAPDRRGHPRAPRGGAHTAWLPGRAHFGTRQLPVEDPPAKPGVRHRQPPNLPPSGPGVTGHLTTTWGVTGHLTTADAAGMISARLRALQMGAGGPVWPNKENLTQ